MEDKSLLSEEFLKQINGGDGVIDDFLEFFGRLDGMQANLTRVLEANICPKCGRQIGPSYIELRGCGVEDLYEHIKKYHK